MVSRLEFMSRLASETKLEGVLWEILECFSIYSVLEPGILILDSRLNKSMYYELRDSEIILFENMPCGEVDCLRAVDCTCTIVKPMITKTCVDEEMAYLTTGGQLTGVIRNLRIPENKREEAAELAIIAANSIDYFIEESIKNNKVECCPV